MVCADTGTDAGYMRGNEIEEETHKTEMKVKCVVHVQKCQK